jgi:hypothetical protein
MKILVIISAAIGGLLAGCDGADRPAVAPKAPSVTSKAEAAQPKAVREVLIKYCSS